MIGDHFVSKCLDSKTIGDPWPHQYIEDTLPQDEFLKLQEQCRDIDVPKDRLVHIFPKDFADHKIKFVNQIHDISKKLLDNAKVLCDQYPNHRWFDDLAVNCHISVTPPLPYKFYIHMEGL